MKLLIVIYIYFLFFTQLVFSKEIVLFDEYGKFVSKYDKLVSKKNLKAGDVLRFQNNKEFEVVKHLGSGNTTTIFLVNVKGDDSKKFALRLPKHSSFNYDLNTQLFLNSMYEGTNRLETRKIPIPKIYDYLKDQYMLVEYIEHDFDLLKFFTNIKSIPGDVLERAEKSLINFAKISAQFTAISDFRAEQMVYSVKENKWYLLDWGYHHFNQIKAFPENMLFDEWFFEQLGMRRNSQKNPIKFPGIDYYFKRKLTFRELRIKNEIQTAIKKSRNCLMHLLHQTQLTNTVY